ncbi:luciferin sulfotransferase-like isoform X2 [Arctopsyche grandis]|uniref:luciferin sulfotransferase-like isoform X2 n=1 Tax=Arctopsyche grandis TaxID=121162 RepID=UPI00406D76FF
MANKVLSRIDSASGCEVDKILLRDFTSSFRCGYVVAEGGVTMPHGYVDVCDKIAQFSLRDDDIFVASFPKSGTTWTQEMVWLLGHNFDYEKAKEFLPARFPFLEVQVIYDPIDVIKTMGSSLYESVDYANSIKSPRYIKTHLPWQLLPTDMTKADTKAKIIYVWRNVKDCLISYYHHCILLEGYKGNFDNFYKMFLANKVGYAPFWAHVLGFWKRRDQENILFLRYEDMKADLPSVIRRVASFLGKPCSEEQLLKLADHLSFENMKKNPAVNYEPVCEMNKKLGLINAEGSFMRSGTVGGYKTYLTQEQIGEIDKWTEKCLEGTGFSP